MAWSPGGKILINRTRGGSKNFRKGGAGSQILERGGAEFDFLVRLSVIF